MNWFGFKDLFKRNYNDKALSFKWINLDWQVTRKIFGPDGAITTPTCKLLNLFNYLYEVPERPDVSVPTPLGYTSCGPVAEKSRRLTWHKLFLYLSNTMILFSCCSSQ